MTKTRATTSARSGLAKRAATSKFQTVRRTTRRRTTRRTTGAPKNDATRVKRAGGDSDGRSAQDFYKEMRDEILSEFQEDLDELQEGMDDTSWREVVKSKFEKTKRQYIEYLMAYLVGTTLFMKTSPPLNVDLLWHAHLLETESYRKLERAVIEKYNAWRGEENAIALEHIDHSVVKNKEGRAERLKTTQNLFSIMGFDPFDTDEDVETAVAAAQNSLGNKFEVIVGFYDGSKYIFRVGPSTKFGRISRALSPKLDIPTNTNLRLFVRGDRVWESETVSDYNLKDGDQIDVMPEMCGC